MGDSIEPKTSSCGTQSRSLVIPLPPIAVDPYAAASTALSVCSLFVRRRGSQNLRDDSLAASKVVQDARSVDRLVLRRSC